jgi:hypothetical protein
MIFLKNQLVWIIKFLKSLHPPLQSHLCFTIAAYVLKLPPRLKTQNHFVSSPLCCSVALTKKYKDAADRWSQGTLKLKSVNRWPVIYSRNNIKILG